jgi:glutaredoxin
MIKVVGNHGCSRCEITKQILKGKGVEFDYIYLSDLPESEQQELMNMAQETGKITLPLILKDNKLVDVKEI